MTDHPRPQHADQLPRRQNAGQGASVLVIEGSCPATFTEAALRGESMFVAPIFALDAALMAQLSPDWVAFSLMAPTFDALAVIERLAELSYIGKVCVVAPRLPNRRMVEVELRSILPTLHLVLVETAA